MAGDVDLTGWSLPDLDALAVAAYADDDDVTIVEDAPPDENAPHGQNDEADMVDDR